MDRYNSANARFASFRRALQQTIRNPLDASRAWLGIAVMATVVAMLCALYPTNHKEDYAVSRRGDQHAPVRAVDIGARHVNTLVMVGLPLVKRDMVGVAQLAVVGLAGTAATHLPKRLLNDVVIAGTRLGQRPHSPKSKGNVPSGHASLASCAAWFVCRRYGWKWAWLLMPVLIATMWARVLLDAHTVSAVFAGLFVGLAVVALFVTSNRRPAAHTGDSMAGMGDVDRRRAMPYG